MDVEQDTKGVVASHEVKRRLLTFSKIVFPDRCGEHPATCSVNSLHYRAVAGSEKAFCDVWVVDSGKLVDERSSLTELTGQEVHEGLGGAVTNGPVAGRQEPGQRDRREPETFLVDFAGVGLPSPVDERGDGTALVQVIYGQEHRPHSVPLRHWPRPQFVV